MKTQLSEIFGQEMDRKDFLRYVGVASLMLLGGGVIMQALGAIKPKTARSSFGYGGSTYGTRR